MSRKDYFELKNKSFNSISKELDPFLQGILRGIEGGAVFRKRKNHIGASPMVLHSQGGHTWGLIMGCLYYILS